MDSEPEGTKAQGRPWAVSCLIPLFFFGGIVWFYYFSWIISPAILEVRTDTLVGAIIFSLPVRILGFLIITVLPFGSGIGVALGKKWGWWLAGFFFLCCLFESILWIPLAALNLTDNHPGMWFLCKGLRSLPQEPLAHRLGFVFKTHGPRMVIFLGLYAYWFSPGVRNYFGVKLARPWKVVLVESGICLAYIGVYVSANSM